MSKKKGKRTRKPRRKQGKFTEKSQRRIFWGLLLAGSVILISVWSFISLHNFQKCNKLIQFPPVNLIISSPRYLSPNEIEIIYISVENTENEDIALDIILSKASASLVFVGVNENNTIVKGTLPGQEYFTKEVKLLIPWDINDTNDLLGKDADIRLVGFVNGSQLIDESVCVSIAPVPWIRSMSNIVSAALGGLVVLLIKEKWDQINKVIGDDKK